MSGIRVFWGQFCVILEKFVKPRVLYIIEFRKPSLHNSAICFPFAPRLPLPLSSLLHLVSRFSLVPGGCATNARKMKLKRKVRIESRDPQGPQVPHDPQGYRTPQLQCPVEYGIVQASSSRVSTEALVQEYTYFSDLLTNDNSTKMAQVYGSPEYRQVAVSQGYSTLGPVPGLGDEPSLP